MASQSETNSTASNFHQAHPAEKPDDDHKAGPTDTGTKAAADLNDAGTPQSALQRSRDREALLARTISALLSSPDPQIVVQRLCDDVRVFLNCDVFFNFLLDPETRRLRLNACGGVDRRLARKVEDLELGASLCGTAAQESRRVVAGMLSTSDDSRSALVRNLGIRAYACHPLVSTADQVIGTLSFGTRNRDQFSVEDLELMKTVTDHVAVAMLRRRSEQALCESRERLRAVLQATGVGLWLNEMPLSRLTWDDRTRELFFVGRSEEPTIELFWGRLHPEDREPTRLAVEEALRAHTHYSIDHRVIDPSSGRVRWIHSEGRGIYDTEGKVVRFDGINYDVTERRAFQAELERLVSERTTKLRELVAELEHFSYTITHDMRAPLRAMQGFAEIMEESLATGQMDEGRDLLRRIKISASRMDCLITDALNYSKAVRNELPLEPVDVSRLLRGMLDTYPEFQAGRANISIEGSLPWVMGNEAGLTQCFSNLVGNALKFVQPGQIAQVRIRGEERGGWVRLSVEDKGAGISVQLLPHVFEMFTHGSTSAAGTGMGLALVRKVVERMGGKVGVESEEGRGSRFWLDLKPGQERQAAC